MQTKSHNYEVTELTPRDLVWFVEVAAVRMLREEVKKPEYVNREQLYALAGKGMEEGSAFICKCDGVNVGALGALFFPNVFNPEILTLSEVFWYVLPEYRSTRAGTLLFKAFDELASKTVTEATLSLLGTSMIRDESLEKRGFVRCESSFRKSYNGG